MRLEVNFMMMELYWISVFEKVVIGAVRIVADADTGTDEA